MQITLNVIQFVDGQDVNGTFMQVADKCRNGLN